MSGRSHTLVVQSKKSDPRNAGLLVDAHALGLHGVTDIQCRDLYFIEGDLGEPDLKRLAGELLSDPVAQTAEWRSAGGDAVALSNTQVIETARRPGVTDSVAEQIVRAAHELGIAAVQRAATGNSYCVGGDLSTDDLRTLAERLLANSVIQHYNLGAIEPTFPQTAKGSAKVDTIQLRELDGDGLLALSRDRRAALDLAEMSAIQGYFQSEDRDPTDVEFEMLAQTWSEHCVHKTFRAKIEADGQAPIDGLLKTYLVAATNAIAAPWVRSAFVDNAGIIDFDDEFEISIKVETHNHPSAIEPFGGANTGVGGVIRDVLGVSAKPIAATDVLCFGPADLDPNNLPEGVLHPRRIRSGVVAGVQDYGNKIGIPTVNGAILYDEGYTANPLVFCGCIGIAPKGKHASTRAPQSNDRVIVLGGRTGSDGLRGATFSSMTMDAQTGEVAGASVQIGDPITEKGLIEVITRARDLGLYHAITDCGAGGLSSAVGEMASTAGADVELTHVRLKYPGLAPWEIWLSEAQERMVLAVPEPALPRLQALCDTYDVELTNIGHFTDTGRLRVRYAKEIALDLDNGFLHDGIPQRKMTAVIAQRSTTSGTTRPALTGQSNERVLLALLATPNVASKSDVIRIYDHEILGGTVVKPLTGLLNDGPSDACVIKPIGTRGSRGIVIANGINPELGKTDAYAMALNVIDEAIRNAVAVGANPDRIAILDNFCWGDPTRPETLGSLVEAVRGCHDAAVHFGTPFISGKDSLNNEYLGADGERHAIPPTLLISALGIIDDVAKAVTMDLKAVGNAIYLVGSITPTENSQLPSAHLYRALHRTLQLGLVRACHDLSEGGLAVAAAEMCIGGRVGMSLTVDEADLFTETNGCLLTEVHPDNAAEFERTFAGQPHRRLGVVADSNQLRIASPDQQFLSVAVDQLVAAWKTAS
ncbi:MAG: phosphoribosylformylglycinamidine synthase subunit PurL [Actinomycetia bacterium]|nr:phosphoribosylformylglycinamidine synthase subunit PurL [Actinomycetes bacterium]